MDGILAELGSNSIITADSVIRLKSYIARKRPDASLGRRAAILADALNRAMDSRLPKFEKTLYEKLKSLLFEHTLKKPSFDIFCSDVFQAAIELKVSGEDFFDELEIWLSTNLTGSLPREQLIDIVLESHSLLAAKQGMDAAEAISAAEAVVAGLEVNALYSGTDAACLENFTLPEAATVCETVNCGIVPMYPGIPDTAAEDVAAARIDEALEPYAVLAYFSGVFSKSSMKPNLKRFVSDWRRLSAAAAAVTLLSAVLVFGIAGMKDGAINEAGSMTAAGYPSGNAYGLTTLADENAAAGAINTANKRTMRMKATAYDLSVASCGKKPDEPGYGITSSGSQARVGRTVAVDPELIPLGSRLRITFPKEYSHLDGIYIAEDTGRLIKGSSIDIFFGEDKKGCTDINEAAMEFGVRYVDVTILSETEERLIRW